MDYSDFKMSHKQAYELALAIFADIEEYVESHHSEYEAFLIENSLEGGNRSNEIDNQDIVA
ncbi:MAG: hypothetical protein HFE30_01595 [Clostridiales bacterium]|nr:hypothetical protein [Clostridiales bacterium]